MARSFKHMGYQIALALVFSAYTPYAFAQDEVFVEQDSEERAFQNVPVTATSNTSTFLNLSGLALQNNLDLELRRNNILINEAEFRGIKGEKKPSLNASASAGYVSQIETSSSILSGRSIDARAQLTIRKNIFDDGNVNKRARSQIDVIEASEFSLRAQHKKEIDKLAIIYAEVGRLREVLSIRDRGISNLERQLKNAELRFQIGEGTRTEIGFAASQLASSRQERSLDGSALQVAAETFRQEFGFEAPLLELAPPKCDRFPDAFQEYYAVSVERDPRLLSLLSLESAARHDLSVSRTRFSPTVDVEAGLIAQANDFGGFLDRQESVGFQARVNVNVPIYNGGQGKSSEKMSTLDLSNATLRRQIMQRELEIEARSIWSEYKALRDASLEALNSVQSAELALRGANLERGEGLRSDLDVLDAESVLLRTRLSHVSIQSRLMVATVEFATSNQMFECVTSGVQNNAKISGAIRAKY